MEWKTWFKHDDGTPRVVYLVISDKTELILADTYPNNCELNIKLDNGIIRQETKFDYEEPGRVASKEVQDWAVQTTIAHLKELAELSQNTAAALKMFAQESE